MHEYPSEVLRVQWVARYGGELVRLNLRAFSPDDQPQEKYQAVVTVDDWDDPILTGAIVPATDDEPMRFLERSSLGSIEFAYDYQTLRFPIVDDSVRCDAYEWEVATKAAELMRTSREASKEPRSEALASLRKQCGSWPATVIKDMHNFCGLSAIVREALRLEARPGLH